MSPAKLDLGVRHCAGPDCRVELVRRPREASQSWRDRLFCSRACFHKLMNNAWPPVKLPPLPVLEMGPTDLEPEVGWQDRAACRGADGELFGRYGDTRATRAVAEMFCRRCPAVTSCAVFADRGRLVGVWGGSVRKDTGAYERKPLIVEAPLYTVPARRAAAPLLETERKAG